MSTGIDPGAGAARRRRLADELAAGGHLRGDSWRAAVEAVPREAFLAGRFYRPVAHSGPKWWEPVTPERVGQDYWLEITRDTQAVVLDSGGIRRSWPLPAAPR